MPLSAVSCSAENACTAVGSYLAGSGDDSPLVARWNGARWKTQSAPHGRADLGRAGTLYGVSCTSSRACTAVTSSDGSTGSYLFGSIAERWNGSRWTIDTTEHAASQPAPSTLKSVSCASSVACMAVGSFLGVQGTFALAEVWNGSSWTVEEPTDPPGAASTQLNGVSCTSATMCVAAGNADGSSLIEEWNGTTWTISSETPNSQLNAVSCTSGNACTAVGYAGSSPNGGPPFAKRWDGSSWTVEPIPAPVGVSDARLNGVACTSMTACIAVGNGTADAWDGMSWTPQSVPFPLNGSSLASVSCTSASACTAVGSGGVVERWDGHSWAIQVVLGSPLNGLQLNSVSCPSSTACTAVGRLNQPIGPSGSGSSLVQPSAEFWNGAAWTPQNTPNLIMPPIPSLGQPFGQALLASVSCAAPTMCVAVGDYERNGPAPHPLPLIERYS